MHLIKILVLIVLFTSCKKKEVLLPSDSFQMENGIAVLCEGLFQQNNSSVSWIDNGQGAIDNQLFVTRSNRQLGDTGNDMQRYGSKVYIVVNVSSTIEVVSANSFDPIKQIDMFEGTVAKQPRYITFSGPNAYVSCYDGFVDVIDTTTLTVTNRIPVGANPEGLTIVNNKLYVANSGGLNFPNLDSTISVIDLSIQSEIQKITVGKNPGAVVSDASGDVYTIARGDYGAIPSRLVRINTTNDSYEETFNFDIQSIEEMNANFLIGTANSISIFNPTTEMIENSDFVDLTDVVTLYKLQYNPSSNSIYVLDAMNYTNTGFVRKYNSAGNYLNSYHVGLNPTQVLFYD